MAEYDSPWKEALDVYFESFLAFFFPLAHKEINWARGYEFLDKEFQQIVRKGQVGRRSVDKLVKVWLRSGEELWVLIHVEIQMSKEGVFPRRMYIYNYRAFDRYNREVVSLAVLADANPRWRPDTFGYERWGFRTEIRFPVVKLWDYVDRLEELEKHPNPFAVVVAAHLRTLQTRNNQAQRHALKIKLIKGLYDRGLSANNIRQLFRLIDWLMELPEPWESSFWTEIKCFEEEKDMPFMTTPERIGRREGLAEGIRKGRAEGLTEGRAEGLTKGIASVLRLRFGRKGTRLMPEIRKIHDEEKLQAVLESAETVASLEDLRRMWTG